MALLPDPVTAGVTTVPSDYWTKVDRVFNASHYYNVRNPDFGAAGDGVTNDTAAINAAISAVPAGGTLVFPPGTYSTTGGHTISKAMRIEAEGATLLAPSGTSNILTISSTSNVRVYGLTIDGNYPTRTSGRGIVVTGSSRLLFEGVRLQNIPAIAWSIGSSTDWRVRDCSVDTSLAAGLRLGEGTGATVERWWVDNCDFTNTQINNTAGHAAIQTQGAGGAAPTMAVAHGKITGCRIRSFTKVGLGLDYLTDSLIEGCEVYGSHTGEAMALTGARNICRGNILRDSTGAAGLLLWCWAGNDQRGDNTIVEANQLIGPGGNQGLGIVPAENSVAFANLEVAGNRSTGWAAGIQNYNSGRTGISLAASVVLHDNHLYGNTSAVLIDAGTTDNSTKRNNGGP